MFIRFLAPLAGAFLLASCSSATTEVVPSDLPAYCIREVTFLDNGRVLIDMPGYPFGMTDSPIDIGRTTYEALDVPVCASNDPRSR